MIKNKLAFVATSALVGSMMLASNAFAQSTGTTEVEAVVITAAAGQPNIDGVITAESAPKAKASVDQAFIATQSSGQTIIQTLNLTPGLNFTNADPYGSSGGNLRIRGFDGNRISLTFDGIPLNDSGNYAIFTNQQLDAELVAKASVNMGTTDVDSPTASAVGGTINYISRKPAGDMGMMLSGSLGSFNYRRIFGLVDTGDILGTGATAYLAGSYQKYDKFKGPGDLEKWQINGKIYQPLGDNGDFVSLAFHYNENRNNFYRTAAISSFKFYGIDYDNLDSCTQLAPGAGAQNNNNLAVVNPAFLFTNDNPANTGSCTNYYGLRINPSNTGNLREQAKVTFTDTLSLTVDSAFQYVLANGGGTTALSETSTLVRGHSGLAGFDLNGDGDTLDTVRFYTPNTTNTRRFTVLGSLIWEPNDSNTFRLAYTFDRARHRQTGEWGGISSSGDPLDVFGGKDGNGQKVLNADGFFLRQRDRLSYAILNQISAEWRGQFMDDNLFVTVGVRAPFFKRELNQYCYTQNQSSTPNCTSQTPVAVVNQVNLVTFVGSATQYAKPFDDEVKYDKILPNVGVSYLLAPGHTVYASYAEGLSAPRTDQLYTVGVITTSNNAPITISDVQPETTQAWDLGYRYRSPSMIVSTALWKNNFQNRIVSAFDPDLGFSVDRNVGDVKMWGFDAQAGWTPDSDFSLYASMSYTNSELQDDLQLRLLPTPTYLPIKGKALVETPEWTFAARAQWQITDSVSAALQGKHVGARYTTDVNDEQTNAYNVVDFDVRFDLPFGSEGTYLQFNVTNLFDAQYYSNISSGNNAKIIPDVDPGVGVVSKTASGAFVGIGSPRALQMTLRTTF